MNRWARYLVVFLLGGLTAIGLNYSFSSRNPLIPSIKQVVISESAASVSAVPITEEGETARVVRVIDGDTIELEGGRRVRYIGINTPETVDPRKPVECFGKEASKENTLLVEGKDVRLEKDVSQTDKYGRLLRYVYVGSPAGEFVNDFLVREGFASVSTFPPDVKYQAQFLEAQEEARINGRGLWGGCSINGNIGASQSTTPCVMKGNISTTGEKIYHMPGCGSYDKTSVDEGKGERWFCTEDEAVTAGWRKAKNCS